MLVEHLTEWFYAWVTGVSSNPKTCGLTVQTLRETIGRLHTVIGCEHHATESKRDITKKAVLGEAGRGKALLMRQEQTYNSPGRLRPEGQRHDSDFANIAQIRMSHQR